MSEFSGHKLRPCQRCRRHIRQTSRRCPFCQTPAFTRHLRTASTFVLGGVAALACAQPSSPAPTAPSSPGPAASSAPSEAASASSSPWTAPEQLPSAEPPSANPSARSVPIYGSPSIHIVTRIQFELNSAKILPAEAARVGEVADVLRAQADRELLVEIEGHCAPGEFNPQQLSKKRAEAVREMLIGLGISPTALRAVASGIERPLVANDSPQNRAINRRVSFQIVKGALSP